MARDFLNAMVVGKMSRCNAERFWNVCIKHSRYPPEELPSFITILRRMRSQLPGVDMNWKIYDQEMKIEIIGNGPVFPKKMYGNSKRYVLHELWTSLKLRDVIRFHVSIHEKNKHLYMTNGKIDYSKITLSFTCDGVPMAKSSSNSLYVLGVRFHGCRNVYLIKTRYSLPNEKKDLEKFLVPFIEECNDLKVEVDKFLGDAPIRSFFKVMKGHSGYYSCEYCESKGECVQRHVCFPSDTFPGPPRSKERWEECVMTWQMEGNSYMGIMGKSPLMQLPNFDIIRDSPADPMHR